MPGVGGLEEGTVRAASHERKVFVIPLYGAKVPLSKGQEKN